MKKLKMSNRRFRRILIPAMALLAALAITVSAGMLADSDTLNKRFGKGERTVITLSGAAGLDTDYYTQMYTNTDESRAAAFTLSRQISDNGIVLLKNDGLLPLSGDTEISPFGLRYCAPLYGVTGSGAIDTSEDYLVTPEKGLHSAFSKVNTLLEQRINQALLSAGELADNPNVSAILPLNGAIEEHTIYEFDAGIYQGSEDSCKGTVGVVFIGRESGENCDASTSVYDDGTPHMLAPSTVELETIAFAKAHCENVVVVLACSSPMQIGELEYDDGIGAILWVGGAGCSGYASLGDILAGNVVPSGRTPDIYPADFKLATFVNQDDGSDRFVYNNAYTTLVTNYTWEEQANTPFHEYEEGVYLGYKYYETAFDIGYLEDYYNRTDGVLYPFGYGLSYTEFSQEIIDFSDRGDQVSLTVRVKNQGSQYAGKDVVQVYVTAPYTEFDRQYAIEKPTAVLMQFEKTDIIPPGGHEDVIIAFHKEDMAPIAIPEKTGTVPPAAMF